MPPGEPVILNVDDTEAGRYAKTRILRHAGYRVIEAGRGRDALGLVEQERPALVLLDIKLPDISGLEVCAEIKRRWPEVLVLQISASMTSGEDRARGLDSGADSYLVQPVEASELLAAVRALLRMRAAETALHDALQQQKEVLELRLAEQKIELERETAQREQAQTALRQAQKMEAVGQLTGGIAHDFNNLLTAILGNLDLARRRAPVGDEVLSRCLLGASEAAERAGALTQRLLAFSRRQPLAPRAVDVNALVRGLVQMISRSLGEQIRLELELGEEAPPVWCDPNQLESAILNLAINARDAMPDGGRLTLRTGVRRLDRAEAGGDDVVRAGVFTAISVIDTGMGMSEQTKAQAFEPFFTTKPIGQGTGLGLSQVYGFARQSHGWAQIDTAEGEGTAVSLVLPQATGDAAVHPSRPTAQAGDPSPGEEVLLVEDEPLVRAVVVKALAERGYRVTEAGAASEALDLLGSGSRFDLMLTDVGLPMLNGRQLAEMAREQRPGLKVLFMTGYARDAGLTGEPLAEQTDLIVKPFSMEKLLGKVRGLLDAG